MLVNKDASADALSEATGISELEVPITASKLETGKIGGEATLDTSNTVEEVAAKLSMVVLLGMIHPV